MSPLGGGQGQGQGRVWGGKRAKFVDHRPYRHVFGEGPTPATIMLVGERPGENEARSGRPFVGLAGKYLDIFLSEAGLDRDRIYITNLVKEYRDYDKPTPEDVSAGWGELTAEFDTVRPMVVGLLGTYAVEALLGWDRANLERTHGVPVYGVLPGQGGGNMGSTGESDRTTIFLPIIHPAAGIYNNDMLSLCGDDFRALALTVAGALIPNHDAFAGKEDYAIRGQDTTIHAAMVAIDTEGSTRAPWCGTWSTHPGQSGLYRTGDNVTFAGLVYLHNSLHDLGVLRALGTRIADDQFRDTMVWAYLLGLEPQGLKDLAYRHAGMEMDSYRDIIRGPDRDLALAYLEGVKAYEWPKAEEYVVIEGGKARIKHPHSINQRVSRILEDVRLDKRNKQGDPVDPRERWGNIEDYLTAPVIAALGPMQEATLDDVPRAKAERYACRDSDATIRIAPILQAKVHDMGLDRVSKIDHAMIPMVDRMIHVGVPLDGPQFWSDLEDKCDTLMAQARFKIGQLTGAWINPDSWKQTGDLLFIQLGLQSEMKTEGGGDSTKDKALERIYAKTKNPVVDLVLDYREASKVRSSYAAPLGRIARRGDKRVHCNIRITRVVTGRLAATNPNLLAIPVRSSLGKDVRTGFVAPSGRVIGDWDLDQVEMRWMADQSRDPSLVQIFLEDKLDVHRMNAAGIFGCRYEDVQVEQRYAAKRVGFGVITGITEFGLFDQMALARAKRADGEAWTLDDCAQMIALFFQTRPGVRVFMDAAGNEAERTGMVRDTWGRIRYLPAAWSPIPAVQAEARRQASSFKIQAGAQGLMKRAMAAIWETVILPLRGSRGYEEQWPVDPILQIHDSQMVEMDEDDRLWEIVNPMVVHCLTQTTQSNTGLPYKAKGGRGKRWSEVKE